MPNFLFKHQTLLALLFLLSLATTLNAQQDKKIVPKREFRGVWVATVSNIGNDRWEKWEFKED